MEKDMLYGTTLRTPTKRRVLGTPTPSKSRKVRSLCFHLFFFNNSIFSLHLCLAWKSKKWAIESDMYTRMYLQSWRLVGCY